ncbi:MAG: DUF342 domain-containing protein [Phycisphaerales bacterium]|nr:DUF342 domain-containing protein [Phycisphaerales bacterium]
MAEQANKNDLLITIPTDSMSATLSIFPDFPADSTARETIIATLTERGIVVTVQVAAAVEQMLSERKDGDAGVMEREVARATPPTHGKDGRFIIVDRFKSLIESPASGGEQKPDDDDEGPQDSDDDVINHRDRSSLLTIAEGELIGNIIPPEPGTDGVDVRGKNLACKEGKPHKLSHDASIEIHQNGEVVALVPGALVEELGRLKVIRELHVGEYVDFSTGNIDFTGDITVNKGVRDGFRISVDGSLIVNGLIEAAVIEATGDAVFRRGMAGREKGRFNIAGSLHARYLDSITGSVGLDLTIDKELVNSEVDIGRRLIAPSGVLFGGGVAVTAEAEVKSLGTPSQGTLLFVGSVPALDRILAEAKSLRTQVETSLGEAKERHEAYKQATVKPTASQAEELTEMVFMLSSLESHLSKIDQKINEVQELIDSISRVDVLVLQCIYANTVLRIRGRTFKFNTNVKGPVRVILAPSGEPMLEDVARGGEAPLVQYAVEQVDQPSDKAA